MARKTLDIQIAATGRDMGKLFHLREMPASQAEKWAFRAFLAMGRSGVDMPDGIEQTGFAGIAKLGLGLFCKLPFDEAEALMDEMFTCVQIKPNPAVIRDLVEDDIEEIQTRLRLRAEVFALHAGFSSAAELLTLAQRLGGQAAEASSNTSTSVQPSPQ